MRNLLNRAPLAAADRARQHPLADHAVAVPPDASSPWVPPRNCAPRFDIRERVVRDGIAAPPA